MRKVIVTPFQTEWKKTFLQEAERVQEVFKEELITIHHIGSTAVPGLAAKPTIDMMLVVISIWQVDLFIKDMETLGYIFLGEYGLKGRRYFYKGEDEHTHHVHIFQKDSDEVKRHLAFRDYLITHPETAEKYGKLKLKLAAQYPNDIAAYIQGKNNFVKEVEQQALKWYNLQADV
ncbi:GrpB family protein [Cerasibacillus sp. JNUCC 74]